MTYIFLHVLLYRYRKYKLGNDIELICRCEHDAVMTGTSGEIQFCNIKTLNEWDSRVSWLNSDRYLCLNYSTGNYNLFT
jgi:hypothetical protein